jgi:hypothetical protein
VFVDIGNDLLDAVRGCFLHCDSTVFEVILNQTADGSGGGEIFLCCGHIVGGKQHPEQFFDSDSVFYMKQGSHLAVLKKFRRTVLQAEMTPGFYSKMLLCQPAGMQRMGRDQQQVSGTGSDGPAVDLYNDISFFHIVKLAVRQAEILSLPIGGKYTVCAHPIDTADGIVHKITSGLIVILFAQMSIDLLD